jgi:hypothetical protein
LGKVSPGALQISTIPQTSVFIDELQVGTTPFFDDKITAGEHTVKLVPELTGGELIAWEGKVVVSPNIMTVVNWELASDEASASGEIMSLERIGKKDVSSLAVVSQPDQAVVKIDGTPKGFSPILIEGLKPGDYRVVISSPGYREKTISANTIAGYKLTINAKLAQAVEGIEEATASAEKAEEETEVEEGAEEETATPIPKASPKPEMTPPEKPYIKVKDTPTGWLRVRMGPSVASTEAAKINPGEMYPYLEEEENGWYKIEYEEDEEGWVSGVYAELVR